jgi:uncharacterized damage-inducible protein DinB
MMLSDTLRTLYDYNRWANERILDTASNLMPEQFIAEDDLPHGSVRNALVHVIDVHRGWLSWCDGSLSAEDAYGRRLDPDEYANVESVRRIWNAVDRQTDDFLATLTDEATAKQLSSSTPDGTAFSIPTVDVLLHLITHAMQHRSEIAVRLTRFGHSPGDLDIIFYVWPKN